MTTKKRSLLDRLTFWQGEMLSFMLDWHRFGFGLIVECHDITTLRNGVWLDNGRGWSIQLTIGFLYLSYWQRPPKPAAQKEQRDG